MHNVRAALILAAFLASTPATILAQPPAPKPATVVVKTSSKSETLDAADLAAMPHVTVRLTIHDETHNYDGVPINRLLALVNTPAGDNLRGNALADAVVIHSRDGYEIVFALAELDPAFHKDLPILADRIDGKPMDDKEGPFRLIVQGELKPARSAKMVDGIEVRALGSR